MIDNTFYDLVEGETHKGRRVYEFTRPCETMVDRHEVSLLGVRFTLSICEQWGEALATVIPGSYDLIRPRIGEWHWENWVFDNGSDLIFGMEYIDETPTFTAKSPSDRDQAFSLLRDAGFKIADTGGGCSAWIKEYPNASILVTSDDGSTHDLTPENIEGGVLVGIIDEDGEPIRNYDADFLDHLPAVLLKCIGIAERFSPETFYAKRTAFAASKKIECF